MCLCLDDVSCVPHMDTVIVSTIGREDTTYVRARSRTCRLYVEDEVVDTYGPVRCTAVRYSPRFI